MSYQIKTEVFEGPLDLLLHLIKRMEIDIYDIPMAEITEQYLLYIHAMADLELDRASEYLVMSATLMSIKSKMLLPNHSDELEEESLDDEQADPRTDLVEQLIEYKKFKEAAHLFQKKEQERNEIFTKPPSDFSYFLEEAPKLQVNGVTIYDMLGAYNKMLRRGKLQKPLPAKVARSKITIEERMGDLLFTLIRAEKKISFFTFFQSSDKQYIIMTFLAMLELMKNNSIEVEQNESFGEIFLSAREESLVLESS